jgi:cobaltochelatase CobS
MVVPNFNARRNLLRTLTSEVLEASIDGEQMKDIIEHSPLIRDGEKQVSVRPVPAGLRDHMTMDAMQLLLVRAGAAKSGDISGREAKSEKVREAVAHMLKAIYDPANEGVISTRSKTGYDFGLNKPPGTITSAERARQIEDLLHRIRGEMPEGVVDAFLASGDATTPTIPTKETDDMTTMSGPHMDERDVGETFPVLRTGAKVMKESEERISFDGHDVYGISRALAIAAWKGRDPMSVDKGKNPSERDHESMKQEIEDVVLLAHLCVSDSDGHRVEAAREMLVKSTPMRLAAIYNSARIGGYSHATNALGWALREVIDTLDDATPTTTTPTTTKEMTMTTATTLKSTLSADVKGLFDSALKGGGLPGVDELMTKAMAGEGAAEKMTLMATALDETKRLLADARTAAVAAEAKARAAAKAGGMKDVKTESDGTRPSGHVVMKKASEVFDIPAGAKKAFSFEIPTWEWDNNHPDVPAVDTGYVFRPFELMRVLYAVVNNKLAWLHGHTGTGKTTLLEQVAARMNYPFLRINFDSEVTRMDLIGKDNLTVKDGASVTHWTDGVLPQMLSQPCFAVFDEVDFGRPDVMYVAQPIFEGNGLTVLEDAGRKVPPHPMFRLFATGNTCGQGDEYGLYQGARVQSAAILDRVGVWVKVDYLSASDRDTLIKNRLGDDLDEDMRRKLSKYVEEHQTAFVNAKVMQPLSPRGWIALGEAIAFFEKLMPSTKDAMKEAMALTILDRATSEDRAVLMAIANRVFG